MASEAWEARWEDDGGRLGPPAAGPTSARPPVTPAGVIVVVTLVPFFLLPVLGLALGRSAGTVVMVVGGFLGFALAMGVGRLLGKRLERARPPEAKSAEDTR